MEETRVLRGALEFRLNPVAEEEGTRGPGCGRGPLTGSVSDESAASMPCAGDSGDEREEELPQSIA